MKKGILILIIALLAIAVAVILFLAYLGYLPAVGKAFGWDKPRDLGVTFTEEDKASARAKSQIEYEVLPANTPDGQSLQRTGSRPVTTTFSSAEASALMNNRPFKYWPYEEVQMKFNADGSAEVSGRLIKDRIPGYAASIGVDKQVAAKVVQYLPPDPVFYVKGRAALTNNKVTMLDPSVVEVGRMNVPLSWILSFGASTDIAYAEDLTGAQTELAKYSGKKQAIVDYINNHLAGITGFYAKSAYFSDNSLHFDGNLNEIEKTAR